MGSEQASGNEQVLIQVKSDAVDDVELAVMGLWRPRTEDDVLRQGAQARLVFIESDEPQHAAVFCRVPGCLSKLSKLGEIDYTATDGPAFASAYGDVAVALSIIATCRCCHVESMVCDTRAAGR